MLLPFLWNATLSPSWKSCSQPLLKTNDWNFLLLNSWVAESDILWIYLWTNFFVDQDVFEMFSQYGLLDSKTAKCISGNVRSNLIMVEKSHSIHLHPHTEWLWRCTCQTAKQTRWVRQNMNEVGPLHSLWAISQLDWAGSRVLNPVSFYKDVICITHTYWPVLYTVNVSSIPVCQYRSNRSSTNCLLVDIVITVTTVISLLFLNVLAAITNTGQLI